MSVTLVKWTLDDYHRMVASGVLDDRPVELLRGEIVERSPERETHAYLLTEATKYLILMVGDRADVRQDHPITLPGYNSEPEPDIAVVRPLGREYLGHHPYPGDIFWLIEFADSSLATDLDDKRRLYAQAQILEYWVVDLQQLRLVVFRNPEGTDYRQTMTINDGELIPLAFPDLRVSVERLVEGSGCRRATCRSAPRGATSGLPTMAGSRAASARKSHGRHPLQQRTTL